MELLISEVYGEKTLPAKGARGYITRRKNSAVRRKSVMNRKQELEKRLTEIERQIRETEKRLPAHSVKPPIMMELFELEDQQEAVLAKLKALEEG